MIPTRPINMATDSTAFDASDSSGVAPSDEPTVKRAEMTSNTSDLIGNVGSSHSSMAVKMTKAATASAITALARRIEPMEMVRSKAHARWRPVMIARTLRKIAATVLTLMPPPSDCDAPPIHICTITSSRVRGRNEPGSSDTNPAERGVSELNTAWLILSPSDRPSSVLWYSRHRKATVLKASMAVDVTSTSLVLRSNRCSGTSAFLRWSRAHTRRILLLSMSLKLTSMGNPIAPANISIDVTVYRPAPSAMSAGLAMPSGRHEKPALQKADSEWNPANMSLSVTSSPSESGMVMYTAAAPIASMVAVNARM